MPYEKKFLVELYKRMSMIRKFEERVKFLFLEGVMPGTIHQYNGQEGVAVGVCSALKEGDVITSTHRPHGHAVARGLSMESLMHELFGKITGCCKGKGGSMHMGDLDKGMVPAVAIVAGAIPMATGMALAMKMKKQPNVVACFMGDGAVNEGAFHEGVNMGAIWRCRSIYVIENNLYSASTPIFEMVRLKHSPTAPRLRHSRRDGGRQRRAGGARGDEGGHRARPPRRRADDARMHDLPHHRPFAARSLQLSAGRGTEESARERTHPAVPQLSVGEGPRDRG